MSKLPTFTLVGVTTFNVNNIESPFIVHWLEHQADRMAGATYPDWTAVVNLYQAALDVSKIWSAHTPEERSRLTNSLAAARSFRAGQSKPERPTKMPNLQIPECDRLASTCSSRSSMPT